MKLGFGNLSIEDLRFQGNGGIQGVGCAIETLLLEFGEKGLPGEDFRRITNPSC